MLAGWKAIGLSLSAKRYREYRNHDDVPYHSLVLLLADVGRDLAVDLAGAERHSQRLGHV